MIMTRYVLADLPVGVRGFVKEDETGEPVYILNARLTREMNLETIRHEDDHIQNNDLHSDESADAIESKRHRV